MIPADVTHPQCTCYCYDPGSLPLLKPANFNSKFCLCRDEPPKTWQTVAGSFSCQALLTPASILSTGVSSPCWRGNTRECYSPFLTDDSGLWLVDKMQTFVSPLHPHGSAWHFVRHWHSPESARCGKCGRSMALWGIFLTVEDGGVGKYRFCRLKIEKTLWHTMPPPTKSIHQKIYPL